MREAWTGSERRARLSELHFNDISSEGQQQETPLWIPNVEQHHQIASLLHNYVVFQSHTFKQRVKLLTSFTLSLQGSKL